MGLKDKFDTLSEQEKIALLLSDGKLIKRPIIEFEDKVLFGFNEQDVLKAIND